jgi:thiol-disulfide isomerase/thioredoxin
VRTAILALLAAAVLLALPAISAVPAVAQSGEEKKAEEVVLTGNLLPRAILKIAPEWRQGLREYKPDQKIIEQILATTVRYGTDLKAEVVLGTWCGDSVSQVPKFMAVQRALRKNRLPVQFMGLDRTKKAPAEVAEGRNIERVPTFIIYHKGVEIGRIVETPKVSVEADLAEILGKVGKS